MIAEGICWEEVGRRSGFRDQYQVRHLWLKDSIKRGMKGSKESWERSLLASLVMIHTLGLGADSPVTSLGSRLPLLVS